MPGTLSVPERMPRSWPPPLICSDEQHARVAAPHVERADALRAVHLVRAHRQQIDLRAR